MCLLTMKEFSITPLRNKGIKKYFAKIVSFKIEFPGLFYSKIYVQYIITISTQENTITLASMEISYFFQKYV